MGNIKKQKIAFIDSTTYGDSFIGYRLTEDNFLTIHLGDCVHSIKWDFDLAEPRRLAKAKRKLNKILTPLKEIQKIFEEYAKK
jgi:hypothetical protein